MKIVAISEIERQDLAVHYRRAYRAVARTQVGVQTYTDPIEFSLELTALGHVDVNVRFLDTPPFPVVPASEKLAAAIRELDRVGELP